MAFRKPIRERQAHQLEKFINDDVIGFAKYISTLFLFCKVHLRATVMGYVREYSTLNKI